MNSRSTLSFMKYLNICFKPLTWLQTSYRVWIRATVTLWGCAGAKCLLQKFTLFYCVRLVCLASHCSISRMSDLLEVIRDKLLLLLTYYITLNNMCSAAGLLWIVEAPVAPMLFSCCIQRLWAYLFRSFTLKPQILHMLSAVFLQQHRCLHSSDAG